MFQSTRGMRRRMLNARQRVLERAHASRKCYQPRRAHKREAERLEIRRRNAWREKIMINPRGVTIVRRRARLRRARRYYSLITND